MTSTLDLIDETATLTAGTTSATETTMTVLEPATTPDELLIPKPVMLNIGCGPKWADFSEWTGIDRENYGQEWVIDLPNDPLPYLDETVDGAVANHFLQQIIYTDLPRVLNEVRRVLRPGATFRILVPDVLRAVEAFKRDEIGWFPIVNEAEASIGGKFCAYSTWYGEARTLFTAGWLCELLARIGFTSVAVAANGFTMLGDERICELDSRPHESLVVEAAR